MAELRVHNSNRATPITREDSKEEREPEGSSKGLAETLAKSWLLRTHGMFTAHAGPSSLTS
jgi:hypothetical protein